MRDSMSYIMVVFFFIALKDDKKMPQKTKSNRNDVQVKCTEKACFLCHDAAVIIQIEFYQK